MTGWRLVEEVKWNKIIMKDNQVKIKTISVEDWYELVRSDADISVNIQLYGNSMYPLIRRQKDQVTVRKCCRVLPGDIVLFQRSDGKYVIHRVWKMENGQVMTMGDNCRYPDPWMPESKVLGQVTHIRRGKHLFCVDTPAWRFVGRVWLNTVKPRTILRKILSLLKRTILSVIRR